MCLLLGNMDDSRIIVLLIALSVAVLCHAMPQDLPDTIIQPIDCTTAKGGSGMCVQRLFCDYNTTEVDKTLYAPKGYKNTCAEKEVCCPDGFQIPDDKKKELEERYNGDYTEDED